MIPNVPDILKYVEIYVVNSGKFRIFHDMSFIFLIIDDNYHNISYDYI